MDQYEKLWIRTNFFKSEFLYNQVPIFCHNQRTNLIVKNFIKTMSHYSAIQSKETILDTSYTPQTS
jgi:hypothetical protein